MDSSILCERDGVGISFLMSRLACPYRLMNQSVGVFELGR
jgi:hypothetical protein